MNRMTRRRVITTGLATAAGVSGLAAAAHIANRFGLIPPDHQGNFGCWGVANLCRATHFDESSLSGPRIQSQRNLTGGSRPRESPGY